MTKNLIIFTAILLALSSCIFDMHTEIKTSMAVFDQAYVQALLNTKNGSINEAENSLDILKSRWAVFQENYAQYKDNSDWKTGLEEVSAIINESYNTFNKPGPAGERLLQTHEDLERIRSKLLTLRRANGIDYFLDYLTVFYRTMERSYEIYFQELDNEDTIHMAKVYQNRLEDEAAPIKRLKGFDKEVFGFSESELIVLKSHIDSLDNAVGDLEELMDQAPFDEKKGMDPILNVRQRYLNIFKMFANKNN